MKRKLCSLFLYGVVAITYVHAACVPTVKLDNMAKRMPGVSSSSHSFLGVDPMNHACWYFRDLSLKNGHGQQSILVYSKDGVCLGWFRTSLAAGAELHGAELTVQASDTEKYAIDLSKGIPNSIFFDGEISNVEKCVK